MNLFKRTFTAEQIAIFDFLKSNKLFAKLTESELDLFLPYLHLRQYKQSEVIFFRNDPAQALYLVKEGKVSIEIDISDKFEPLSYIGKAGAFGNSALLPYTKRTYNAFVQSPFAQLYVVPQVNIQSIFERKPTIQAKMLEALAENYHNIFHVLLRTYRTTEGFLELSDVFKDMSYGS
jgi:CRP/FNR family transcriptional regulator, cyclic AMP receptor protein